ncbi:metallophosphoesterase family protein [Alicyclobacillus fodiniaquatilis]|uniref:Metallophosphoesterase family protein n=1 Tax=Alicyclobacillus fodiniaquatilis TaxID=1661150 RepID=A0ABW4JMS0_9BACL
MKKHLHPMETLIRIPGLQKEISIMQITDSHLTEVNAKDEKEIQQIAAERTKVFQSFDDVTSREIFAAHIRLCNGHHVDGAVFTGDIIDFPSHANLEGIKQEFETLKAPYLYTMGNHDWSYPHLAASDELRLRNYSKFRAWSHHAPGCEQLELGGVNLIAIDNSNYQVTPAQFHYVEEHAKRGPCLLFMHIPLYVPSLEPDVRQRWQAPIMMGATTWTTEEQQRWHVRDVDDSTATFRQWLLEGSSENIWGIFCGHVHFAHVDEYRKARYQYVTEPGFLGGCRLIQLKPADALDSHMSHRSV